MVNKELIFGVLDYIETHPKEWDQEEWFCETTACFGGRALLMSGQGYRIIDTFEEHPADAEGLELLRFEMVNGANHVVGNLSVDAAKVLGLPEHLAHQIFGCMVSDPGDLRKVVEDVVAKAEAHAP